MKIILRFHLLLLFLFFATRVLASDLYLSAGESVLKVDTDGVITIFASGISGGSSGLAFHANGDLYIKSSLDTIYKVTQDGTKSIFVKSPLLSGIGAMAFDSLGTLYACNGNHLNVVKILSDGSVSVFAPSSLFTASAANMAGLAIDKSDNVYVSTWDNHSVLKITPSGDASVFYNGPPSSVVSGLAFDSRGNLYAATFGPSITKVTPTGVATTFATGGGLQGTWGLAIDGQGTLYGANYPWQANNSIAKVTTSGVVSVLLSGVGGNGGGLTYIATPPPTATTDADNDGVNYYRETADGTDPDDPNSFNSLSKGLVAYYPFNGNADDESGNERNGVATAITYDTDITGRPASSAVFANGSAVDIPSLTGFQFRPVTYSLWVYFSNIQSNRETTLIGRKRAWAQSDGGVTVETRWAVNNELKYSTGGTIITSGFEFDIGQWYHIVFTQDAQSEASFYVNGELLSSQPFTAVQDTDTFPFRLGAESALDGISSGEGIFNGQMDKVRIYDRALSAQEVTSLYTSEPDMADSDADGLYDFLETQIGTDPNNPDTDGDGLKDGAEHLLADLGFSPLDNNSAQAVTLFSDPNNASLFTQSQYESFGTLRFRNGQSDVTTNPAAFNLFTQNQVAESYTQGQNSVLQSIPSVDFSVPASTPFRVTLSGQNVIGVVVDDTESPLPDNWRLDEQAGQLIGSVVGSNSISVVLEGEMAGDAPAIRIPLTFYPQAAQTIAPFARIPTQAFSLAPLTVTPPAASSGFAVVLSVKSGPATIVDNQVTFTGVGKVDLAANQIGNKDMKAAPEVTTSFLVTKGRQNMSFPPLNSMPFVQGSTFQLSATTSSALPIAYTSSNPRVISISGSTATIVGRGVATIRATQSGDSNWAPATPISRATRIY